MGGSAQDGVAEDVARDRWRKIILAEVEYVGTGGERNVGAVVDGQQCVVAAGGIAEDLQGGQLIAGLQGAESLLAERSFVS